MAFVSILLGSPRKGTRIVRDLAGLSSAIFLDATLSESITSTVELTQHPVERRADITDHAILRPDKLCIKGIITETPIDKFAALTGAVASVASTIGQGLGGALGGAGGALGALGGGVGVTSALKSRVGLLNARTVNDQVLLDPEGKVRADNKLPADNVRLRDAIKELTDIKNARQPLKIITGLKLYNDYLLTSVKIEKGKKRAIIVELEFDEFFTATSQLIAAKPIPKHRNALPKTTQGKKDAVPAKETTILKDGVDFVKRIFK